MAEKKWSELMKQYHTGKKAEKTQNKGTINAEKYIKLRIGQKETLAICVTRYGAPCDKCTRQGYCLAECADFMEWERKRPQMGGIYTGQEAIDRMAKAICLERHACISKGEMCGLCELWRNFSTHAEAALIALLEGK